MTAFLFYSFFFGHFFLLFSIKGTRKVWIDDPIYFSYHFYYKYLKSLKSCWQNSFFAVFHFLTFCFVFLYSFKGTRKVWNDEKMNLFPYHFITNVWTFKNAVQSEFVPNYSHIELNLLEYHTVRILYLLRICIVFYLSLNLFFNRTK